MPSRWDSATRGWRRRVFHYPPPTLMSRNFRLPCAIELQPLSLTPLKMRKVEVSRASGTPEIVLPAEGGYCRRMSQRSAGMGFPTLPDGALYRGWDCFLPPAIALHQSESCRLGGLPSRLWFAGRWPWRRKVAINTPACCLPNS